MTDLVGLLLSGGADANVRDLNGNTPLSLACKFGHGATVVALLEAKADPWVSGSKGNTALHYACFAGHLEIVERLLALPDFKAHLAVENQFGETCLDHARSQSHPAVVSVLRPHMSGISTVESASRGDVAKVTVRAGSDAGAALVQESLPNNVDGSGQTDLCRAAGAGQLQVVTALLRDGAEVDAKDSEVKRAFSCARFPFLFVLCFSFCFLSSSQFVFLPSSFSFSFFFFSSRFFFVIFSSVREQGAV